MGRSKRVLIVDGDKHFTKMLSRNFKAWGFQPESLHTGAEALNKDLTEYILVITELDLPVISGKTLLETYHKLENKTPVVVVTNVYDDELKNEILNFSFVSGWYRKPIDLKELRNYVSEFIFNELAVITQYDMAQTRPNIDDSLNFKLLQRQVKAEFSDIEETAANLSMINSKLMIRQKDNMEMIRVPSGIAIIGSDEGSDIEKPLIRIQVKEFFIDKYPVTNAQYEKFLRWANSAANPDLYSHEDQPRNKNYTPKYWNNMSLNHPDKPVVGVDWYDAYAYSRWANDVLDCETLPTEFQREFAARGVEGYTYPWGNDQPSKEKANYKTMFGETTSVFKFNTGKTELGIFDLSGNVWEWCLDWFSPVYYMKVRNEREMIIGEDRQDSKTVFTESFSDENSNLKVLRGGSFINEEAMLKGSYRGSIEPLARYYHIGFRCAICRESLENKGLI